MGIKFRWVMEIINTIEGEDDRHSLPNLYYAPELENKFIVILSRIPLWSNIMVAKFNSTRYCASSAESENYFKLLKSDFGTYDICYYCHVYNLNMFTILPYL